MRFLGRFKYIIVSVLGIVLLTVVGENSLLQRYRYARQITELEEEIDKQETRFTRDSLQPRRGEEDSPRALFHEGLR